MGTVEGHSYHRYHTALIFFSISYVVGTIMVTKYSMSSDVFWPPLKLGLCD